jgi:hypothetical protein
MTNQKTSPYEAGPEQLRYAQILGVGMYFGLLILLITFAVYALGLVKPYIPIGEMHNYWGHNVHKYIEGAHVPVGWGWVRLLGYGDILNFVGIVLLAGVTIVCYLSIVPLLWRNNDRVFAVLAVIEVLILCLAASGILAVGE